jgi:hypothetical protein
MLAEYCAVLIGFLRVSRADVEGDLQLFHASVGSPVVFII